uniref:Uncharacterized protein n=1 Tax=Rhizophora mucronata TaxID=61149 RepID=A0A2P2J5E2_RHIMU
MDQPSQVPCLQYPFFSWLL